VTPPLKSLNEGNSRGAKKKEGVLHPRGNLRKRSRREEKGGIKKDHTKGVNFRKKERYCLVCRPSIAGGSDGRGLRETKKADGRFCRRKKKKRVARFLKKLTYRSAPKGGKKKKKGESVELE